MKQEGKKLKLQMAAAGQHGEGRNYIGYPIKI